MGEWYNLPTLDSLGGSIVDFLTLDAKTQMGEYFVKVKCIFQKKKKSI
jgi:hypothetical protein